MIRFNFWGWDKKKRTKLRFIKPGDIFCFKLDEDKYCFGRIISKIMTGHVAEIFNLTASEPIITDGQILESKRLMDPIVLDSYTLFDRQIEQDADWRIIGHQENYIPTNIEDVFFTYGVECSCKKVDVFGNEVSITEEEAKKIPELSPLRNVHIAKLVKAK
ncbi:Imm26 family immunity protein [Dickeya parazeae]|uniref:Imm26 family immunity protein n=1 Tax=Dickeya parazeae TaxID=2893572 RepID=UPI001AECC781|nr:Imm26 family immunity protein [Dickeya parazeae]MBP2836578.1 immunity 26/phosphotriesterase HocA family protein [Dickeya parazeae]